MGDASIKLETALPKKNDGRQRKNGGSDESTAEEQQQQQLKRARANDGEMSNSNSNKSQKDKKKSTASDNTATHTDTVHTPISSIIGVVVVILITIFSCPSDLLRQTGRPDVYHVWYYGWITAVSTGLGVVPLFFVHDLNKFWIGCSNALAAGMMLAASYSLFMEGTTFDEPEDHTAISSEFRTLIGAVLGLVFILGTKSFLERHEEVKVFGSNIGGADARRVLLIFFVMTLHSFSEGVGVGVSFGGENGRELGMFISVSLAVHNVPEGLAVAIVLLPQKTISKVTAMLWCITTSLPQPFMAVPAYLFVSYFVPILPVGLGFAGGAMAWVAVFELLGEAYEDTNSLLTTGIISVISFALMLYLQVAIDEGSRSNSGNGAGLMQEL